MKPPDGRPRDAEPLDRLSATEQHALAKAERRITAGLKSFLEVGLALKEIRDKRLYRQVYRSFEAYVSARWDFSRPRAYELLAASDVVADLSAIADIGALPANEAQVRPLTRLKFAKHRQRAWKLALNMAAGQDRPVTARDSEEAVRKVDGKIAFSPVNGVPVYKPSEGLRAAYADPPYIGQAKRRYGCPEVDHEHLIERLETFDSWALSLSSTTLPEVLPLCPQGVRVGAWVKPFCVFKPNVNPAYAWEPVIFKIHRQRTRQQPTIRDWHSANMTMKRGLCGVKPDSFCFWLFDLLNLRPGDEFIDLYEGSGAVTQAFRRWLAPQMESTPGKRP